MKSIIAFVLILTTSVSVSAQGKTGTAPQSKKNDTIQYSLGVYLAQVLIKNGLSIENPVMFKKGFDDALQQKPLMVTPADAEKRLLAYQKTALFERGRKLEERLFNELKTVKGVGILPNGIHYITTKTGDGERPGSKDTVVLNIVGTLPDGTVFEDTQKSQQSIVAILGNLIPGVSEAVQLMPQGSLWRIFIPAAQAYGDAGTDLIPPASALIMDIALVEVRHARKQ